MDVIGFLYVSLGSSTVQLHDSLGIDVRAQVYTLVSVVKRASVLEESILPKSRILLCVFMGKRTQCKCCL
jgi:hypothetical protein